MSSPEMLQVRSADALHDALSRWRKAGHRIALVPTMGNLHAGHFALVEVARRHAQKVVVSIFVNPTQFGAGEDFDRYPRTPDTDADGLLAAGADLLFAPDVDVIYPFGVGRAVRVHVPGLSDVLCGASRPGHFDGVATVVLRLFNLVQADLAVFGEKDYQQLLLVRRLVADLSLDIEILSAPTVREPDGLAMSSRNRFLDVEARRRAAELSATLRWMSAEWRRGSDRETVEAAARARLAGAGLAPDYCVIRRADDLGIPSQDSAPVRALVAARVGSTRLIDNMPVSIVNNGEI